MSEGSVPPRSGSLGRDESVDGTAARAADVGAAAEAFRLLADVTRLSLLACLRDGEVTVNELAARVGRPPVLVSQHLAKLRAGRLVLTRRHGNHVLYRLADDHVRALVTDGLFHAEHLAPGVPGHHQENR